MPKQWFVLRVQSNREDKVKQGLSERIKAGGLEGWCRMFWFPARRYQK